MNTAQTNAASQNLDARARRKRDIRRARTFFLIALMATLVSVAGHCLPGDSPVSAAQSQTQSSAPGH